MTRAALLRLAGFLLMAVSVAVVVWAIARDEEGLDLLRSVEAPSVAALTALLALSLPIQAYRYKLAVDEAAQFTVPAWEWFRLFVIGRFMNALLPQAGNAYRAVRLKEDYEVPVTKFLSGFLAFTWLSTLLNMAAAFVVILVLEPGLEFASAPAPVVLVGLLAVTAAGPPLFLSLLRRLHIEHGFWGWAYRRTEDMVGGAVSVSRSRETMMRFVVVGIIGLTVTSAAFWVAFDALELPASASTVVLFYGLQQLGAYVNITPGNLGVQELYSGGLAAQLGIGLAGGVLVAALIRVTSYVTLLLAGGALGGFRALAVFRSRDSDR